MKSPHVSVLMPTFKHALFIRRAIESLRAQTFGDWELILVDDGSPDETAAIVAAYLDDPRVHYHRRPTNEGLGAALNFATTQATGRYIAYLPSDDVYYPDHLERLLLLLDERPDVYLAYGGVRWNYSIHGATLQGDAAVGREAEALENPPPVVMKDAALTNGNLLALVQVMHRRDHDGELEWAERGEIVSDCLEPDFWRALLGRGAQFAYAGALTCEWVDHPDQHHKIIAGLDGGMTRYRAYYGVGRGQYLNWQPSRGVPMDERERYGRWDTRRELPDPDGLKILLVGELGFNPDRIVAFEERGHKLYGLWVPEPERWDATGPFPFGNIDDVPLDRNWIDRVREIRPDIIYALLNWQAVALIDQVLEARLNIPLVFHFKEGPFLCLTKGLWPALMRTLCESDGQIFISPENRDWFQLATAGMLDEDRTLILDGDPPKIDWMKDDWTPKLSEQDGEIHTVCPGRPLGLDPFDDIARAHIHVHFYGRHFQQQFPNWTRKGVATGYMHIHPTVEPEDWVRELSQYDAAWFHVVDSFNGGDLRRANWDDLNLPARLGTFAAAGLPWIMKDNRDAVVAIERLARRYDAGVMFRDYEHLAAQLHDRSRVVQLTANMRAHRHDFAFDTHVDGLIGFFRKAIEHHHRRRD